MDDMALLREYATRNTPPDANDTRTRVRGIGDKGLKINVQFSLRAGNNQ